MSNIATKLTYLNGTKQAIKQAINEDFEVIDNNTTFREYAEEISSNNAKYKDLIPKETKNATNTLDISNSAGLDKALVTQYGNTIQDGEPTPDAPVEIQVVTGDNTIDICGKNIINIPNRTYTNSTISVVANDGVLTINGTNSTTGNIIVEFTGINNYTTNQNITMVRNGDDISDGNAQLFLTVDGTEYNMGNQTSHPDWRTLSYSGTITRLRLRIATGASYTNFKIKPMLYLGDYDSSILFEPYKGASYPISLDYTNLFKKQDISSDDLNKRLNQIGEDYNENGYFISPFIKVDKDTQYTINYTPTAYTRICYYASNNTNSFISKNDDTSSFTTPSTCQYLRFCNLMADIDNIRLEKGSTITNNYIELCKIGDYKDRIYPLNGKWYLEKKIGKVVLNGTETWHLNNNVFNIRNINDYISTKTTDIITAISDKYLGSANVSSSIVAYNHGNNTLCLSNNAQTTPRLFIRDDRYTTTSDFANWLSTHNTTVYYVLATLTYTEITKNNYPTLYNQLNNIKLYEGVNHITMTNESGLDVEFDITYYKDWKLD